MGDALLPSASPRSGSSTRSGSASGSLEADPGRRARTNTTSPRPTAWSRGLRFTGSAGGRSCSTRRRGQRPTRPSPTASRPTPRWRSRSSCSSSWPVTGQAARCGLRTGLAAGRAGAGRRAAQRAEHGVVLGRRPATWNFRTDYTGEAWAKLYGEALDIIKPLLPTTRFWMGGLVGCRARRAWLAVTFIRNAFTRIHAAQHALRPRAACLPVERRSGDAVEPVHDVPVVPQVVAAMRTYGRAGHDGAAQRDRRLEVKVPNEQNRNDIMTATPTWRARTARSSVSRLHEHRLGERRPPEHWYGLVAAATTASSTRMVPHGPSKIRGVTTPAR